MDTFAQILDETFWGLNAEDSIEAQFFLEVIKELVSRAEEGHKADLIPKEVRVI